MAQSDQVVQNATFPNVRADINDNLAALYSQSSGNTAPTVTVAYQPWIDTSSSPAIWKVRNGSNTAWITIGTLDPAGFITSTALTALLPSQSGNAGKSLISDGTTAAWNPTINSGTAVATTSGTSVTITGIPSWAKRVTVMCNNVTTNGTSYIYIRAGAGSVQITGYYCFLASIANAAATSMIGITDGFLVPGATAADIRHVSYTLTKMNGNTWMISGTALCSGAGGSFNSFVSGLIAVSGTLDRISLTTVGGVNTFNGGTFNITYE
jgi:hypothetical protein